MGFKRCVRDRISFLLLILGTIATDTVSGQSLECTNDFSATVSCHFKAQNCTEYSLTLKSNYDSNQIWNGLVTQCVEGQCCSSIPNLFIVLDEIHTATVWKGNKILESKDFSVKLTLKPKAPTIRSVKESNGNFQVMWDTNMETFIAGTLEANLTYHKKGDTGKVSEFFKPSTIGGFNVFDILGQHLESSTTYVVSVKSYTKLSGLFSDSSNEWEFTTAVSPVFLPLIVIVCLSCAAVIITSAIYVGYVKVKRKWWVAVSKCPNPKLGVIYPSTQKVLMPGITDYSIVCVEHLVSDDNKSWLKRSLGDGSTESLEKSSGISTGSSCVSYPETEPDIKAGVSNALQKVFPNIASFSTTAEMNMDSGFPSAPYQPCQADDVSSEAVSFSNQTYSILIPSSPHQIPTNNSEVQTQAEMPRDFGTCVDPQAPSCLLVNLSPGDPSLMPTDMSYQQCKADSGGSSYEEAFSSPAVSCETNCMMPCDAPSSLESRCERSGEAVCDGETEGLALCEETSALTAGSRSFPPVDDDYQPFQNLAAQLHTMCFDESGDEKGGHLNKYPGELVTETPQSISSPGFACFIKDVQGGAPLSLMPADPSGPLMSDPGYHRV